MWTNIAFYAATLMTLNLACIPHAKIWDKTLQGTCVDTRGLELATAVVNLVFDIIIMALPQRTIWNLRMPRNQKIGISILFAVDLL
jgi:hypothetical protein